MSDGRAGAGAGAGPTLVRFLELCEPLDALDKDAARAVLRELQAVGGDLKALRSALTGVEHGPELWFELVALGRDEALARAVAALQA